MATTIRRPLPTLKVKHLPPPRLLLPERSTTNTKNNGQEPDPIEKRILNIRLHLLQNTTRRPKAPNEPTLVFDSFLYLGGIKSLTNPIRLTRLKITHILSVVLIPPATNVIPSRIKHLFLKADDNITFNIRPYFEQTCEFIEEARQSKGSVLIHCVCGVSRSATLCCAYLMKNHLMTVEQALVQLRSRRHIIQPNVGFLRQLLAYEEELLSERTNQENATVNAIIGQIENI